MIPFLNRQLRVISLLAVTACVLPGCRTHWSDVEWHGVIKISQNWSDAWWNWEGTSRGVDNWRISAKGEDVTIAKASFHLWGSILLVNTNGVWEKPETDSHVFLFDTQTGRTLPFAQTTCPTIKTPMGAALVGELATLPFTKSDFAPGIVESRGKRSNEPGVVESMFLTYELPAPPNQAPDEFRYRGLQSVCLVTVPSETNTVHARLFSWPTNLKYPFGFMRLADERIAGIGCRESDGENNQCALFVLETNRALRVVKELSGVDGSSLAIRNGASGPELRLRRCEDKDPCWATSDARTADAPPFPIGRPRGEARK